MDLPTLHLRGVTFPGAAGMLQRSGNTASLVRELGDNYRHYHDHLAAEFDSLGGRPVPADYDSFEDYAEAWGRLEAIVHAEITLRRCHGMRIAGAKLDAALDGRHPLIGPDDRLRPLGA
jgi:hypothetical protein